MDVGRNRFSWVPVTETKTFNIFDSKNASDPYPLYREMRETAPVYWDEQNQFLVLTRYEDITVALKNPKLSAERVTSMMNRLAEENHPQLVDLRHWFSQQFLFQDPPKHTRLRGLVAKAFTPRLVEAMRPRIEAIVSDLIAAMRNKGKGDLIRDFAVPLPLFAIGDMLGVSRDDRHELKTWSDGFATFLSPRPTLEQCLHTQSCLIHFAQYFRSVIEKRRMYPEADLISELVRAEDEGGTLSEQEMLATLMLLLSAGHETTTNLIGNGIFHLLTQRGQFTFLRDNLFFVDNAVEEILRYESPVHLMTRTPIGDSAEICGFSLMKNKRVVFLLGAAHRDPDIFPNPDRFDIRRDNAKKHMAFGQGIHFCLGAPLARLEANIAIRALVENFPLLRMDGKASELQWRMGALRGIESLPIRWDREP